MSPRCASLLPAAVLGSVALVSGCGPDEVSFTSPDGEPRGGIDAGEADTSRGDALTDEAAADSGAVLSGPLSFIAAEPEITVERLCDLDGDGLDDNALADLGQPHADMFAMMLTSAIAGDSPEAMWVGVHFPWLDDLTSLNDPDATLLFFICVDIDVPQDSSDDLSGEEPFYASARSLDACGEPLHHIPSVVVIDGLGVGGGGSVPFPYPPVHEVVFRGAHIWGDVVSASDGGEAHLCGHLPIRDLGALPADTSVGGGLSMLEMLLHGGGALGVPIPGLDPDLDLDGDGLERLTVDDDGRVLECIDGDGTVIEGRDCWLDERMADSFAASVEVALVPMEFLGREPGWERLVSGECEAGPPEPSLFDPL